MENNDRKTVKSDIDIVRNSKPPNVKSELYVLCMYICPLYTYSESS